MALSINGSSGISGVDGSAGTPALQGSDTNTGISFGTDTVNINTGGTTRATVDSSGRVGIGTTSPGSLNSTGNQLVVGSGTGNQGLTIFAGSSSDSNIYFADGTAGTAPNIGYIQYRHASDRFDFGTVDTTRMSLDSAGRLLVGTSTALVGEKFRVANNGAGANTAVFTFDSSDDRTVVVTLHTGSSGATSRKHFAFLDGGGFERGSISVNGSATAFNTSSDYRLKENVTAVTDGITRLQQLKPSRFNFIADPDTTVDGFIAHEVQTVVPEAIAGEKDAVDADGNPIYQGIDQSKLVPLLTAALQEAIAKIETLETRLTALEGGTNP